MAYFLFEEIFRYLVIFIYQYKYILVCVYFRLLSVANDGQTVCVPLVALDRRIIYYYRPNFFDIFSIWRYIFVSVPHGQIIYNERARFEPAKNHVGGYAHLYKYE